MIVWLLVTVAYVLGVRAMFGFLVLVSDISASFDRRDVVSRDTLVWLAVFFCALIWPVMVPLAGVGWVIFDLFILTERYQPDDDDKHTAEWW